MKVLLASLNSKYVHSNLALKYLYVTASQSGAFFEIKEFTINNNESYMFSEILAGNYDVICFSCYIWNIEETLYLAENIKKAMPNVIVVLGGPEVSYGTKELMAQNDVIDFVVMGEGEYTFSRLIDVILLPSEPPDEDDDDELDDEPKIPIKSEKELAYEGIKGLAYRNDGEIIINEAMELLVFETVPFPYRVFPCEQDKIIYYQSSRGCPFSCSYCISSLEKKLRALPIERVFQDVDYFLGNKVKQVKFIDRTFNWDSKRCNDIIRYIIERDNGITNFHFEICGEFIDDEFISLLKTARDGLFRFEVGIQSTHKKTLAAVRRSAEVEKVLAGTRKLTELNNVFVHVDLIAGLPFEDYNRFQKTFNDAYNLFANTLQLGFLKMLKGTDIRLRAEEYRYEFRSKAPYEVISNMFLSVQDLCRLKQIEEVLDLYYNRGGFENTLKYAIETFVDTPFEFFEELAIFFNLKGFQHKSHKKEDVYRIFYEYGTWKTKLLGIPNDEILANLTIDIVNTLNPDAIKKFERKGWQYV